MFKRLNLDFCFFYEFSCLDVFDVVLSISDFFIGKNSIF